MLDDLIQRLFAVSSPQELSALLKDHPDLERGELNEQLRGMAAIPGYGAGFAAFVKFIEGIRTRPEEAWSEYRRWKAEVERLEPEVESTRLAVLQALEDRDYNSVVAVAEEAARAAWSVGLGASAHSLLLSLGQALVQRRSQDRAADLERAIEVLDVALAISVPNDVAAAANLGIAYLERVHGDVDHNLDRASELFEAALERLPDEEPELQARMRTNLATVRLRRRSHDRRADLLEAEQLCRAALRYRNPERDALNWAYSQMNLGEALEQLAGLDDSETAEAIEAYEWVVAERARINEPWMVGAAFHSLGRLRRHAADRLISPLDVERNREAEQARMNLLRRAAEDLDAAKELLQNAPDPMLRGRLYNDLGAVADALGHQRRADEFDQKALQIMRPTASPEICREIGWRLGNRLARRGEWEAAATAFKDAIEAAELRFHGQLASTARHRESTQAGNLSRWAAFALAKAGYDMEAALALENGRALELRRRVGLDPLAEGDLSGLPEHLVENYMRCTEMLAHAPIGPAGDAAARAYQVALSEIRALPGHESFAAGARVDDLAGAVEEEWPLIYVNPTPFGTLLLCLRAAQGQLHAEAHLASVTAIDVYYQLTFGVDKDGLQAVLDGDTDAPGSFMVAVSGHAEDDEFARHIEQPLAWLGENVARHIAKVAGCIGSDNVSLICCGPIAIAPLHAATWEENGDKRSLLDSLCIRYEPSATVCAIARTRASRPTDSPRLVLLADPESNLSAAEAEGDEIARHFAPGRVVPAVGPDADRAFLVEHAQLATHLHLSCHGGASLLEGQDAVVRLADGLMGADELAGLRCPDLRLAVVSACQSAVINIAHLRDEVLSVGSVLLAAGAAGAIASLWSVQSLATAMLMTRLYDEMFVEGRTPPAALREAQLWLRDLTEAKEREFLNEHPALASEFRRQVSTGRLAGRRSIAGPNDGQSRPYAHPDFWAAFVALGV